MFLDLQSEEQVNKYERLIKAVGSLSKLFSEASEPYLSYRAAENLFCKAFEAENLSRSDASADASKDRIGFALKTFVAKNSGCSTEKIAEFNSDHQFFSGLATEDKIKKISELRNERIETSKRIFDLDSLLYHCVTRDTNKVVIFEQPLNLIDIDNIEIKKVSASAISFTDSIEDYSFNISKSTLYKKFVTDNILKEFEVRILQDPFSYLERFISEVGLIFAPIRSQPHVFLPLYSTRSVVKNVPEKSGLNQWNAGGRKRDINEIYIPIPSWIHKKFPTFFPPRDNNFDLILPDRYIMSAKVCQDNSKAIMSNPNSALGQWLLRKVLNLAEQEILTYDKLQEIGLDSVVIYKIDNEQYDIDFTRIGSYENFYIENNSMENIDSQEEEDEE